MKDDGLSIEDRKKIIRVIEALLPGVKIYLYGSRARGKFTERSDIDLALDMGRELALREKSEVRQVLEALGVFYRFDVVDLHRVSQSFLEDLKSHMYLWNEKP